MTLSTIAVVHRYKPGSAEAPEAIPFQYLRPDYLRVERVAFGGQRTLLARDVDFVLAGNGVANAGTIAAIGDYGGDAIEVTRVTDMRQEVPIPPGQPIPAREVERAGLDRLAMVDQEQGKRIGDAEDAIRRLEASTLAIWFDPGVDPELGIYFDPGVDPVVDLRFDPGDY